VSVLTSYDDGRLFGRTWGTSTPTVVALHGWLRDHHDFDAVFDDPAFGADRAAVALDLPGFGATPPPERGWSTLDYATAVDHLLESFGGPVTVIGHSFGGRVATRLAAMSPHRVDRLVLTGVPLVDRADRRAMPARSYRVVRRLHRWGLLGEERMEAARRRHGSPDYRSAQGTMREVFVRAVQDTYDEDLARIACPTELVWGGDDREVPVEVAERASVLLQSARLSVWPGVGHLTPLEIPGVLRSVVLGVPVEPEVRGGSESTG